LLQILEAPTKSTIAMSFGFSATDFVKAIELVASLVDALRASGEARSRFSDLIGELYALESTLIQVKRLRLPDELEFQRRAVHTAASRCQDSIEKFWCKISTLQPHLQVNAAAALSKTDGQRLNGVCSARNMWTSSEQPYGDIQAASKSI
jgi:hypothetical protein